MTGPEALAVDDTDPLLRQRHLLLDFAVSHSPAIFYIAELESGRPCKFISSNVESLTGHPAAAFLAEPGYGRRFVHPDDLADYARRRHELRRTGTLNHEYRFRATDGQWLWFRDEVHLVGDSDEREIVGCMIDVTQEKAAKAEREKLAQRFHEAVESLQSGFTVTDAQGRMVACNSALGRNLGVDPAAVLGKPYRTLIRQAVRRIRRFDGERVEAGEDWVERISQRLLEAGGQPVEIELAGGNWVLVTGHATAEGGRVTVGTDISRLKQAEAELRRNERYFRSMVEDNPLPVWLVDLESAEILYASPAAAHLVGREWPFRERAFATEFFVEAADRAGLVERLRHDGGQVLAFETRFRRSDGEEIWVALNTRFIEFQGRAAGITGIVDLTERKRRERELGQAQEMLEDAIEALSDGFVLYDAADRLVLCNSQYRTFNHLSADLLRPGAKWAEITRERVMRGQFPEALPDIEGWMAARAAEHGRRVTDEFPTSAGRWYEHSHRRTRQGGVVITWRDITERREREEALRRAHETLEDAVESLSEGFALYDGDDRLLVCNQRYRDFNATCADVVQPGMQFEDLVREGYRRGEYPISRKRLERWLADYRAMRRRAGSIIGFEYENAQGRWYSYSSQPTRQGGRVVTVGDVTERKTMEGEMARQREALHQSEKLSALGQLLASVAHELNNPLSVVVGQALLLKETAEDKAIAARAERIGAAADRCARIVKTFLAMARQQPQESLPVNPSELVEAALEVTGYALRAAEVEVSLSLARQLPPVLVDPDQLTQVFANLLVNAEQALRQAASPRRLRITSRLSRQGDEVVIKVKDNGPGVPKRIRGRVFDPFFTTKSAGTGIGLAICHRILESHGGRIKLEPTPGGGATFVVRLPAMADAAEAPAPAPAPLAAAGRLSILVVDDEPEVASLIRDILRRQGHRIELAGSGEAALARLGRRAYDVVLSDLRMPGMDGRSLFSRIAERHPEAVKRLAFVTGDTMSPGIKAFLEECGRPYLEKPITPAEVRALVAKVAAGG